MVVQTKPFFAVGGQQDGQIRRCVGVLTETPGLYDNLSAEYNLRIFAELYEVKDSGHEGAWRRHSCTDAS